MHKITSKPFKREDFSLDHSSDESIAFFDTIIERLENLRQLYLVETDAEKKKQYWYDIIQLLPTSYNQMRTVTMNYETLVNIYFARRNHKLIEWHEFCDWIKSLPYAKEIIVCEE